MRLSTLLLICLMTLFLAQPAAAGELASAVSDEVAADVVRAIKESTRLRSIAVGDIDGASSEFIQSLERQLTSDRHFIVVERNQLDRILKEQGIQLSDLVSEDSRIEPGQIRGVECLLSGEVKDSTDYLINASLTVFLKLSNVQNGEVLMAGDFSSRKASKHRTWIIAGAVGLVVFFIVARVMRRRREQTVAQTRVDTFRQTNKQNTANSGIKQEVLGVVASVSEEVRRAEALASQSGDGDGAVLLRRIDERLDGWRDGLITLPWNESTMKNVAKFHAGLNQMLPLAVDVTEALRAGKSDVFDATLQVFDEKAIAVSRLMTELR